MVEDSMIEEITALLNSFYKKHKITVDNFSASWVDLSTCEKQHKRVFISNISLTKTNELS